MTNTNQIHLWGRAWELSVKVVTADIDKPANIVLSSSSWDPESLRVVFEIQETMLPAPFWFADVSLYNMDDNLAYNLLYNAVWLTLKAGYQVGDNLYDVIWEGPILQVLFDRENVVDRVVRFNCIAGPWLLESQFISANQGTFKVRWM